MKLLAALLSLAALILMGVEPLAAAAFAPASCCCESTAQKASDCGCPSMAPCAKQPLVAAVAAAPTLPVPHNKPVWSECADEAGTARFERPPSPPPKVAP